MTISPREYILLAAIAVLACALWWFGWHERRAGENEIVARDQVAVAKQIEDNQKQAAQDAKALQDSQHELDTLKADYSGAALDLGNRLGLCLASAGRAVPRATPATAGTHGATPEPDRSAEAGSSDTEAALAAAIVEQSRAYSSAIVNDAARFGALQKWVAETR